MRHKKILSVILLVVLSAVLAIGCSMEDGSVNPGEKVGEMVTIEHEVDKISVEKNPERVVVFDYGILDTLDHMGEDIVGLPKASVPPYLDKYRGEEYTDVGTLKEPNFETIYELEPDLIIISARQLELYDEFKRIAPTLYLNIDGGDYITTFKESLDILGKIFDKEDLLAKKLEEIETDIASLNELASSSGKNALFIMANDGNLSAFGPGSRFGMVHEEFGVAPVDPGIEASTHGVKVTFEYILEKDPDYIYVMDRATIAGGDLSAKQMMDNELIKSTKAYENDNIVYLDPYIWYVSTGGITGTQKAIEEIRESLE